VDKVLLYPQLRQLGGFGILGYPPEGVLDTFILAATLTKIVLLKNCWRILRLRLVPKQQHLRRLGRSPSAQDIALNFGIKTVLQLVCLLDL